MSFIFFFNDTATTEIYTLSLHDALPICIFNPPYFTKIPTFLNATTNFFSCEPNFKNPFTNPPVKMKIGEHTSELQSRQYLVCRLLLEKKKHIIIFAILVSTPNSTRSLIA